MDLVRFGVYWANLDPTVGSEINKTRPVIIISPDEMNKNLKTVLVCPLTSTIKIYPSRIIVTVNGKVGSIAIDQMRAIDKSRIGKKMAVLNTDESEALVSTIIEIVKIKSK